MLGLSSVYCVDPYVMPPQGPGLSDDDVELGRNGFQYYSADLSRRVSEHMQLEGELHRALEREEFVLHYQPKVDIASGAIVGVEALLRWRHPDLAMVGPNQFIPLAEETGLIVPIGRWVLRTACQQATVWQRDGMPRLCVAVNLSARQFSEDSLLDDIRAALEEAALPAACLELEITESMVMQNPDRAVATLARLRACRMSGVNFSGNKE